MAQPKKFSPMRFTAATEEAAVEGALALVGAARDEVDYEVIGQTAKGVTVRVRPHDESAPEIPTEPADPEIPTEPATDENAEDEGDESEFGEEQSEPAEDEAPLHIDSVDDFDAENDFEDDFEIIALDTQDEGEDLVKDEADAENAGDDELDYDADLEIEGDEYDFEGDDFESENDEVEDAEVEPEREVDPAIRERALGLARAFLEKMGLEAEVVPGEDGGGEFVPLIIEGEDVGILIGKHGATLQSFQYLINLTLNNDRELETEGVRVTVDAGNYRARRQSSLEAVARGAAQRARREGQPVRLEPMPANERRIVHNFLQSEPGIVTQSEGREPHRCVVIAPGRSGASSGANRNSSRGMGGYTRGRGGRGRR